MELLFRNPEYLWLLFFVPIVLFLHFYSIRSRKNNSIKIANFDAMARIKGVDIYSKNIYGLIFSILIIIFLSLSASGVYIVKDAITSEYSLVIAIDSSLSMSADDITPSRIEAAKDFSEKFVENTLPGTNIGVVSFSGNAFIEQELTDNKALVISSIRSIQLSEIGGTDLYEAIFASSSLLENEEAKAMILISDGRINVGTVDDALNYALANDLVVNSIALGTVQGGNTSFGISRVDQDSLKSLAYGTNGKFYSAIDNDELNKAYNEILGEKIGKVNYNLSGIFALIAIILFIIGLFIREKL